MLQDDHYELRLRAAAGVVQRNGVLRLREPVLDVRSVRLRADRAEHADVHVHALMRGVVLGSFAAPDAIQEGGDGDRAVVARARVVLHRT